MGATRRSANIRLGHWAAPLALAVLGVLAVLALIETHAARASGPIPITDCHSDEQIQRDAGDGGSYYFTRDCNIALTHPLMIHSNLVLNGEGHTVTLGGGGPTNTSCVCRAMDVSAGNVTLIGVSFGGSVTSYGHYGANGIDGQNGEPGTAGSSVEGGAMYIGGGALVTIRGGVVIGAAQSSLDAGQLASDGGNGGNGGGQSNGPGGDGGNGAPGATVRGGAIFVSHGGSLTIDGAQVDGFVNSIGGIGGDGAGSPYADPQGTGGHGGQARSVEGGAIYNAGTLTLEDGAAVANTSAFSDGGGGGNGANYYSMNVGYPNGGSGGDGSPAGAVLGAGIYNIGTLSVDKANFRFDAARSLGGAGGGSQYPAAPGAGASASAAEGGAVYTTTSPKIFCATFEQNSVQSEGGAGGAQYNTSGYTYGPEGGHGPQLGANVFAAAGAKIPRCPVDISVGDTKLLEPTKGSSTNAQFKVTLSYNANTPVTVDYATKDGTATVAHGDYEKTTGTLTFKPNGPLTQSVPVPVNGTDLNKQSNFYLMLSNAKGATLTKPEGTATIEVGSPPSLSVSDTSVTEPASGQSADASFTVSLSKSPLDQITVDYATQDGTATTAHGDYKQTTGTLTFEPGKGTEQTVDVPVYGTGLTQSSTFSLVLSHPTEATLQKATGTATISNGPVTITTPSLPSGSTNGPYSATLTAQGGVTPYAWSIPNGSLPPGLNLDTGTGAITGTPTTDGSFGFTAEVTDSTQPTAQTDSAQLLIVIGLAIDSLSPPDSPTAGGGTITVNGSGFGSPSSSDVVVFYAANGNVGQGVDATNVTVVSDSKITAKIPQESSAIANDNGHADVVVQVPSNGGNQSSNSKPFTYVTR